MKGRLIKLVERVSHLKFIVLAVSKSLPGVMWTVVLMMTAFILLNVVVGIVVNVMGSMQDDEKRISEEKERKERSTQEWKVSGRTKMDCLLKEFTLLQDQMFRVQEAIELLREDEERTEGLPPSTENEG